MRHIYAHFVCHFSLFMKTLFCFSWIESVCVGAAAFSLKLVIIGAHRIARHVWTPQIEYECIKWKMDFCTVFVCADVFILFLHTCLSALLLFVFWAPNKNLNIIVCFFCRLSPVFYPNEMNCFRAKVLCHRVSFANAWNDSCDR